MKKKYSFGLIIALMLFTASATFVISLFAFSRYYNINSQHYDEANKYLEVREAISKFYVGEYDDVELTDESISAVIDALGDEWSYYLTDEQYETYQKNLNNLYEGMGINYSRTGSDNFMVVEAVTPGSPANEADLAVGDIITEINGQCVSEMDNNEIKNLIMSKSGSFVDLTIGLGDDERTVQVEIKEYHLEAVTHEMLEDNIAYIRISNFDSGSGDGAILAVKELLDDGAEAFIFDVRNNGGGLLSELLLLLDYLLPEGDIFITADKDGNETVRGSDMACVEMPMAVLVNSNSYSAAEYFGAILQEFGWAEIVGEATTGKGRSQITVELSDGSAVHISSKKYYTPERVDLSEAGGIKPDFEVKLDDKAEDDNQLNKAMEIIGQY